MGTLAEKYFINLAAPMKTSLPGRISPRLLALLGFLTAGGYAFPDIVVLGFFLFLLPGIILIIAPAVFFPALAIWLLERYLVKARFYVSVLIVLAVFAAIPMIVNWSLERGASAEMAGDIAGQVKIPANATLAIISRPRISWRKNGPPCDDFCQRALLNGAVKRVLYVGLKDPFAPIPLAESGNSYHLERRATCPKIDLQDNYQGLYIPVEGRRSTRTGVAELLRLKMARGLCVIRTGEILQNADAIIVKGPTRQGKYFRNAGFNLLADTISARQISLLVRQKDDFIERLRVTDVSLGKLYVPLIFSYDGSGGLRLHPGLMRYQKKYGSGTARTQFSDFLLNRLGLPLAIQMENINETRRQTIVKALGSGGAVERATVLTIQDYFAELRGRNFKTPVSRAELELALRLMEDRRLPFPRDAWAAIKKLKKFAPDMAEQAAKILFGRLFEIDPALKEDHPNYLGYQLTYLSQAIGHLPDSAILPYRQNLERLARDPSARLRAKHALRKLGIFGAGAVPAMLRIIDDAEKAADTLRGKKRRDQDKWRQPYTAGLRGLCRAGKEARTAIPELLRRLDEGTIVVFGGYVRLAVLTLIRVGIDPDELWPHVQSKNSQITRQRFDGIVRRARGDDPERICSF